MSPNHTSKRDSRKSAIWIGLIVLALAAGGAYFFMQDRGEPAAPPTPTATIAAPAPPPNPSASSALPVPLASASALANGEPDLSVGADGLSKATVTIHTARGDIKFKFYTKDAPHTVDRIVELIRKGFYSGLTFHRVESWVIQGGDPTGTGTGGSGQRLKAEFNRRVHKEGTVGMARAMDPDSADSQFYITFSAQPHLDGQYTVFGQVTEGMDVVRKIQKGDVMTSVTIQ